MTLYETCSLIVGICWFVFIVYWLISAISAKKSVRGRFGYWGIWIRILLLPALVIVVIRHEATLHGLATQAAFVADPAVLILGTVLAILGITFAVWARVYLGRNWGMPQTLRENPELVTTGPYKYVRHPIYTGVLLAMIGSALTINVWWALVFVAGAGYFIFSATREEKDMTKLFPDTYPAYKKRSKMLIPFIF
jgi:protein-S-isoprenylcysteine O-methyltransferase Ste14